MPMRPTLVLGICLMLLTAGLVRVAVAQEAAVGVATYIEIRPESREAAIALLRAEAEASRRDDGCQDAQVLGEIGRDNRFVVLQNWKSQAAFETHGIALHARHFRDQLGAITIAPFDERVLAGLWQSAVSKVNSAHSIWVVTHVDVMPPNKNEASGMLEELGEISAQAPGNRGFVVAQQSGRPNHFTVSEIWADQSSLDAHQTALETKHFRDRLGPMLGALYDQRLYRLIE